MKISIHVYPVGSTVYYDVYKGGQLVSRTEVLEIALSRFKALLEEATEEVSNV
jgi:hypothetical protein